MTEGYLIVDCKMKNLTQVELLIKSIRLFDKERPISIIAHENNLKKYLLYIDQEIFLEPDEILSATYFHSLLASPYTKTIAFNPDQILTNFNIDVWENLRGMNSIVMPKTRSSFNGELLDCSLYTEGSTEQKSFGEGSIIDAIYFNRDKGCDYVFGMAVLIASQYNQNEFIDFFADKENNAMPPFPKYLWPEWLMSFMYKILGLKITKFDFVNLIDLSLRENSYVNDQWSKKPWPEFLSYWVNDQGDIKIENYVQLGLVKYNTSAWLTAETLTNLRKKFI
jgi:hypothetical protein